MSRREDDLELLRRVLALDLRDSEREAFDSMLEALEAEGLERRHQLTEKQRAWVETRAGDAGDYKNLVSSGKVKNVCTVPTAPVLLNLPKKPPGRT